MNALCRFGIIFILFSMLFSLFSCSFQNEASLPETSANESFDAGEKSPTRPEGYPTLCGSFVQPSLLISHSPERMEKHLQYMLDVGIDILILQWSFITEGDKVNTVYYEDSFDASKKTASFNEKSNKLLETILAAAEKLGMKVFVGLNDNSEWWEKHILDIDWVQSQAELGTEGAKQIYDTYKEKYPNALHGWYFVFEFWNEKTSYTQIYNSGYLLDAYRDALAKIDPDMPFMLSPFINHSYSTAAETGDMWKEIFKLVDFREGDIFCPQDSVGAEHTPIDMVDGYFREMKRAVDSKDGLLFWANNEAFVNQSWSTASLHRFIKQMDITSKYVSAHVTFAYSHHLNPDSGKTGFHNAYKTYFEAGKLLGTTLQAPNVTYEIIDANTIEFSGNIDNSNSEACRVMIEKNGKPLNYANFEQKYGTKEISFSFSDTHIEGDGKVKYEIYAVDYFGNESPRYTLDYEFKAKTGRNIALGKKYTSSKEAEANYQDINFSLTNGVYGNPTYGDNEWAGYLISSEFVIDLEEIYENIFAVSVNTLGGGSAGILAPTKIEVQLSDDGVEFTSAIKKSFSADKNEALNKVVLRTLFFDESISARYVKITVSTNTSWIFIDELTVIAE